MKSLSPQTAQPSELNKPGPPASAEKKEERIPLIQHLEELRGRLLICLGAVAVGAVLGFTEAGRIIEWLKLPAGEALPALVFLSPAEALMAYLKVAVCAGFVLAMPILFYEIWAFIRPGLSDRERRYGLYFIGSGSLLFAGGIAFAYRTLLPTSLRFLLDFGTESLRPMISISQYLEFSTTVLITVGFVFELPLAVFFLTRLGIVNPRMLLRRWRVAVVGMTIAASLLTPTPDLVNMMLLLVPLLILYQLSIGVSWLACLPRRAQRRQAMPQ